MNEIQAIICMVIMSATLIILAMVSKEGQFPTQYQDPVEQYYYNTDEFMVEPKTDNIDYIDIDDLEFNEEMERGQVRLFLARCAIHNTASWRRSYTEQLN